MFQILRFRKHYGLENVLKVNNANLLVRLMSKQPIFNNSTDLGLAELFENNKIYDLDLKHLRSKFLQKQVFYPNVGQVSNIMFKRELINPHLFNIKNVYDVAVFARNLIDGKKKIEPVEIVNSSSYLHASAGKHSTGIHKIINRLKKAAKVLLYG
jgi:hypothetical protein